MLEHTVGYMEAPDQDATVHNCERGKNDMKIGTIFLYEALICATSYQRKLSTGNITYSITFSCTRNTLP